ncbi:MAG: abscisic acid-deficient protein Aba4 family protein, partial [Hyphomicrobiales bacterium]
MEAIFSAGNMIVLPCWLLLILLPYWRGVAQFVTAVAVPVLLSLGYTALIGVWWSRA